MKQSVEMFLNTPMEHSQPGRDEHARYMYPIANSQPPFNFKPAVDQTVKDVMALIIENKDLSTLTNFPFSVIPSVATKCSPKLEGEVDDAAVKNVKDDHLYRPELRSMFKSSFNCYARKPTVEEMLDDFQILVVRKLRETSFSKYSITTNISIISKYLIVTNISKIGSGTNFWICCMATNALNSITLGRTF
jgi:hypothetical protein